MRRNRFISLFSSLGLALAIQNAAAQLPATTFTPNGVSAGGEMVSGSINPYDNNQLHIACDMMGVYKSGNQGQSWSLLPTSNMGATVRTKIQYTSSGASTRQYAIRRLNWGSNQALPCVSTDSGVTWTPMSIPASASSGNIFGSIHVDIGGLGASTQRLVLEDYRKIWLSLNGGTSYTLIHHHTATSSPPSIPDSIRVAGVFWNGNNIYVGTNLGIFVSTNNGTSWALETGHTGPAAGAKIFQFCGALHPVTSASCLFAIYVDADTDIESWSDPRSSQFHDPSNPAYLGLYSMVHTSSTTPWTANPSPSGEPFRLVDASVSSAQYVWAIAGSGDPVEIYRSTDGGATWSANLMKISDTGFADNQNVSTGYGGDGGVFTHQWGPMVSSLDVADFNSGMVIVTGPFPYITTDSGATWKQVYVTPASQNAANTTIPLTKTYASTGLNVTTGNWVHWINSNKIFVGSADIGIQHSTDAGATWRFDRNMLYPWGSTRWGNCYCVVKRTGSSRLYAAVSEVNDMYEPERLTDWELDGREGDVLYSDDEGVTWNSLSGPGRGLPSDKFPGPVVWLAVDPDSSRAAYIYASVVHSTLGGIYRSTNDGATWTKLTSPARTEGHPNFIGFRSTTQLIATYSARIDGTGAHTSSAGVYYSSDGGTTWADRTATNMQVYTRELCWNPTTTSTWFASVQGAQTGGGTTDGKGGIYRTTNSGTSWTRIFTHEGAQSSTYIDGSTPRLYVTTSNDGLYICSNPNAATPTFTKVTAFPFARARRVFPEAFTGTAGTIWITTQGGGVWRGTP